MAEKTLNTRIKLRYASYDEWKASTLVLLQGEVALCYVASNNAEIKNTAPTVLMKVGDGTHTFKDLQWASARAADVYNWAKQENLVIESAGTGNVVASIAWDAVNKKFVYQTAAVATAEGLETLQNTVDGLSSKMTAAENDIKTLKGDATTEGSVAFAVAAEAKARDDADKALDEKITTNANAIKLLTDGVDPDTIDGVNDLINYVNEHGTEVTTMQQDISTLKGYFDEGGIAKNANQLDGHDSTYFAEKTATENRLTAVEQQLGIGESGATGNIADKVATLEQDVSTIKGDYLKAADKTELSTAITAEQTRATEAEKGLGDRIKAIEDDYLKSTDTLILDCGGSSN